MWKVEHVQSAEAEREGETFHQSHYFYGDILKLESGQVKQTREQEGNSEPLSWSSQKETGVDKPTLVRQADMMLQW